MFENHTSGKSLLSGTYKELLQLNHKKRQANLKTAKDLNSPLSKENKQMVNRHMKRCITNHQGNANKNHNEI